MSFFKRFLCFNRLPRDRCQRTQEDPSRSPDENYQQNGLEEEGAIADPQWSSAQTFTSQDLQVYSGSEMSRAQRQNYLDEIASWNQHHFHETAAQMQPDLDKIERNIHNVTKITADKLQQDLQEFNSKIQGLLDKMVFKMMCSPPERQETILHNLTREHENILGCLADLVTRVQHNLEKTAAKVQSGLDNVVPWVQSDPKETPAWCEHDQEVLKMYIRQDLEVPTDQLQQHPIEATDHIQKDCQELVAELQLGQMELTQHNLDEEDGQNQLQLKTEMDKSTSHTLSDLHVPVDQFEHDQNELSNQIGGNPEFIRDETGENSQDVDEKLSETLSESGLTWEEQAAVSESHTLSDLHVPVDQFEHDQNELSNQIGGNPEFIRDETGENSQDEDEKLSETPSESRLTWEEQAAVGESELKAECAAPVCKLQEESGSHISLDSFVLHKVLGRGSFGKVLLAEFKESGEYYAIKTLKKGSILAEENFNDIVTERKVLMLATGSPFLAQLYCTFQTEDNLFFVMEYINGGDLLFNIQQRGQFDLATITFYAAEIICGLQFLHNNGVIYRDLKLENTMLDGDGHIKLVDFGICKDNMFGDSRTNSFCGTLHYIAPEIYLDCEYSTSVDWWAFGVLIFQLLTGEYPFAGEDIEEICRSVCDDTPQYPDWINQNTKDFLGKLLEKDPDFRLGAGTCGNIREHPFFESIDWPGIERREVQPPFKPTLESPDDCSNFDEEFLEETPELSIGDSNWSGPIDQSPFLNFSFTHPKFCSSCEN